uniref:Uncharacterized protein n=1 Tax=Arundo donax TaxID=35708 RepID=A0A0A9D3U9_ARUDO
MDGHSFLHLSFVFIFGGSLCNAFFLSLLGTYQCVAMGGNKIHKIT